MAQQLLQRRTLLDYTLQPSLSIVSPCKRTISFLDMLQPNWDIEFNAENRAQHTGTNTKIYEGFKYKTSIIIVLYLAVALDAIA